MQLYYSPTSPFARKVHMLVLAAKLPDVELVRASPLTDDAMRVINPLGKIPALVDGDLTLIDSPLICEYLDEKVLALGHPGFMRRNAPDYYLVQRTHALADGILDAAVATVMEGRRQDSERSSHWLRRWHLAITGALEWLEKQQLGDPTQPHIGTLAVVAALGYLDFRLPELRLRRHFPWTFFHVSEFSIAWRMASMPASCERPAAKCTS